MEDACLLATEPLRKLPYSSPSHTERLKGLRVPTLVIHGDEDPILPLAHGEATAEAVPDATLVVLRGSATKCRSRSWTSSCSQSSLTCTRTTEG